MRTILLEGSQNFQFEESLYGHNVFAILYMNFLGIFQARKLS